MKKTGTSPHGQQVPVRGWGGVVALSARGRSDLVVLSHELAPTRKRQALRDMHRRSGNQVAQSRSPHQRRVACAVARYPLQVVRRQYVGGADVVEETLTLFSTDQQDLGKR